MGSLLIFMFGLQSSSLSFLILKLLSTFCLSELMLPFSNSCFESTKTLSAQSVLAHRTTFTKRHLSLCDRVALPQAGLFYVVGMTRSILQLVEDNLLLAIYEGLKIISEVINAGESVEKRNPFVHCWWKLNWCSYYGK